MSRHILGCGCKGEYRTASEFCVQDLCSDHQKIVYGKHPLKKLQQEMEGMWEHIRNLERAFLSPQDYQKAVNKIANDRHDQVVSAMAGGPAVKPNCY